MEDLARIETVALFPELHSELIHLLKGLTPEQWQRPTVCKGWQARDIAAHLLDSQLRRLSLGRDGLIPPPPDSPIHGYDDLVRFLNQWNAEWVRVARRMSPRVITDILALTGPQLHDYFAALDPDAPAAFPVSWAGESESANWFDIAREYTERWHHQQQIRDAVGAPALYARRLFHPVLAAFVRALPVTYREVEAPAGTCVAFLIEGEAGGAWTLQRDASGWKLWRGVPEKTVTTIKAGQDIAWRIFTKGFLRDAAREKVEIIGDKRLGAPFLGSLAVMA